MSREIRRAELMPGVLVYCVPDARAPRAALSPAERQVLVLAVDGKSNAEIAELRGTSARTTANLLARAYKKLGVWSRADAAARFDGTNGAVAAEAG